MIPVTKEAIGNYQVITPDGILLQEVTNIIIKGMTDQSYVCDLYADGKCVAKDRRFSFADMICHHLSIGETGLVTGEFPIAKWTDVEIKMYLDSNEIEYTDELGVQLIALIPILEESE